ncbi:hypothetical protein ACFPIF_19285 [Brevundimonas faecalis]|uniref:hypothetical protein n=1 Tax=Brevundimonas faecalis TaxID=947378 RepID=UPI0036205346
MTDAPTFAAADATEDQGPRPIREALREDAAEARAWADHRVKRARDAVRDEPIRACLYALGLGVVIGMMAGR